jgi:peptidoglycan/xylan/chitin deacetylase (PgdA/CDA1 family)
VDGKQLASGTVIKNGVEYMRLAEAAEALGLELKEEDGVVSFVWRRKDVRFTLGEGGFQYGDRSLTLEPAPAAYQREPWVPVQAFCDALEISVFLDEEEQHLYCTPGAGDWALPEGYKVPVLMYHGVNDYAWTMPSLFVTPAEMEEQLVYLLDEGWDPIWFEDLEHVEEYDKPIILTFDDGYVCNYNILFPLLQKYNVKATFFIITNYLSRPEGSGYSNLEQYLTWDNLREMDASGLCSIQSHTEEHLDMGILGEASTHRELEGSKLMLVRQIGKEPFVVSYPEGKATELTYSVTRETYRFGVKMSGPTFVTGSDDPVILWRIFIPRGTSITTYEKLINQ